MPSSSNSVITRIRSSLRRAGGWRSKDHESVDGPPQPYVLPGSAVAQFERAVEFARGQVKQVAVKEVVRSILGIVQQHGIRNFASWDTPLLASMELVEVLTRAGLRRIVPTRSTQAAEELAELELAVSQPEYGIGETGSVMLFSGPGRPRLITAMARHHVAVLPIHGVLPTLEAAAARMLTSLTPEGRRRSQMALLTGPTRTGDIEALPVLGVAGPRTSLVLLVTGLDGK